jgi:hypothetical protein
MTENVSRRSVPAKTRRVVDAVSGNRGGRVERCVEAASRFGSAGIDVLGEGGRPLKRARRLGLWSIHWIVSLAGGSMDVTTADLGGTRVIIHVPSAAA